jgi:hypothetical protein
MENPNPYRCSTKVSYNETPQCFEIAFHFAGGTTVLFLAKTSARTLQSQIAHVIDTVDYQEWEQRTIAEQTQQRPEGWDAA